jgi:hypothetical protein
MEQKQNRLNNWMNREQNRTNRKLNEYSITNTKQHASVILVEFYGYKDSVMRVAGLLWVPTMHSRDILLQAKRDHLDRVHSDQMVLEMIRRGRLVRWSSSSVEAKSLKTRVKGTVQQPLP